MEDDSDADFLEWAKANSSPRDQEIWAKALEAARDQCAGWQPARRDSSSTERVGTEVRDVAVAKFVALYLVDPNIPETERGYEWAVHKATEIFRISERTVQDAYATERLRKIKYCDEDDKHISA